MIRHPEIAMIRSDPPASRGFALPECAAVIVVGAVLVALLMIGGERSRRLARLGEDIAKLKQLGAGTATYAADQADLFWSFSWKQGHISQYPDLTAQAAQSDLAAAAAQAVEMLRRLAGREDIPPINGWVPHVLYSTLVLQEHLGTPFPTELTISSADTHRLKWARNPACFDQGCFLPCQPTPTSTAKRWPYSASFQLPPAFYDGSPVGSRVSQAGASNLYSVPPGVLLSGRPVSEVAFPSHKVLAHDEFARHFGTRVPLFALAEARMPLLFADGSVHLRTSADANPGWLPNQPPIGTPTMFASGSSICDPNPLPVEQVPGRFRWTRGTATQNGLAGRDFGGPETCSGQPGCP